MKTVAIIQARMGSTRLPGKVLAEVMGKPLLQHMIERLNRCEKLDDVVVAASEVGDEEALIGKVARVAGACVTYGKEDDVLGRVLASAEKHRVDVIVELTADCPLIDPALVDKVVERYLYMTGVFKLDILSTTRDSLKAPTVPYYPRGMDVRVFYRKVLEDIDKLTVDDPVSREHVSLYAWEHRNRFHVANLPAPEELCDDIRLTVDTPEDLELVRTIFEELLPHKPEFGLEDILELLEYRPELREINRHVQQKAVR